MIEWDNLAALPHTGQSKYVQGIFHQWGGYGVRFARAGNELLDMRFSNGRKKFRPGDRS